MDFVKGMLVVAMAIYHTLDYFVYGPTVAYRFVTYVAEAFIFYSGFLCGTFYLKKYGADAFSTTKRLLVRALKLLALFLVSNVFVLSIFGTRSSSVEVGGASILFSNAYELFFLGNDKLVAFEILIPISYLLALTPIFLLAKKYSGIFLVTLWICIIATTWNDFPLPYNAKALIIGITGLLVGIEHKKGHLRTLQSLVGPIAFILMLVYFSLSIPLNLRLNYFTYVLLIHVVIGGLTYIGKVLSSCQTPLSKVWILGQYSLLMYLFQILFLRLSDYILTMQKTRIGYNQVLLLMALLVSSILVCKAIAWARESWPLADKGYRLVFA